MVLFDSLALPYDHGAMPVTYYTIKEIAERLGLSRQRVHKLIDDRNIPTVKEGRTILVREGDLVLFEDRKEGRPRKTVGRPRKIR